MTIELDGTTEFYKNWEIEKGKGVNLATDTFRMLLTTDEYVPDYDTHTSLSDVTGEVTNTGYARQALANVTWALIGDYAVFSFDPVVFEAPDEDIPCKYWVIYDDTHSDVLVCAGLLDGSGNPVSIEEGRDMTISFIGGLFNVREVV